MAWIGKSIGIFKLHDSDHFCGSFLSLSDAAEILCVSPHDFSHLPIEIINDEPYLSELVLHRAWSNGMIPSPLKPRIRNATRSLDEIILIQLLELALPGCIISYQIPFGRKYVDIGVTFDGQTKYIEFVGPSHFIPDYHKPIASPLDRKKEVEDYFQSECVIWPFWIQRCTRNIVAIFSKDRNGFASVWSTKGLFGDFVSPNAADMILEISNRFGAVKASGLGYMYGNSHTEKPIHPIVKAIQSGKQSIKRLFPLGNSLPDQFWLPSELWKSSGE